MFKNPIKFSYCMLIRSFDKKILASSPWTNNRSKPPKTLTTIRKQYKEFDEPIKVSVAEPVYAYLLI